MLAVIQGLLLGLAFTAPIGAQNVYLIRLAANTPLSFSSRIAIFVSLADIVLGLACLLGLGAIFSATPWLTIGITVVGTAFLLFIGMSLLIRRPQSIDSFRGSDKGEVLTWPRIAGTVVVLTWFNPQALIDGAVILGSYRTQLSGSTLVQFALGMAFASLLWFHILILGVGLFRRRFGDNTMLWINRVCGALLCLLGLKLGATLIT